MGREKEGYRETLELLEQRYPGRVLLTIEEVMEVTGYTSRTTVRKYLGKFFVNNRISKVHLARYLCG
jgi:hypothetical protein